MTFVDHALVWCVVEIYRRLLLSVLIDAQNTAANHGFLSRDGIVTFAELTDAQQNVYGVGYDLAVLLAVLGVGLDGDPITTKLSLGCDATSRTATPGLGPEGGLSTHNKFEGDTSLTRNDFYLANGDNFRFNRTLYNMMSQTTGGLHNRKILPLQDRSDRPWLIPSSRREHCSVPIPEISAISERERQLLLRSQVRSALWCCILLVRAVPQLRRIRYSLPSHPRHSSSSSSSPLSNPPLQALLTKQQWTSSSSRSNSHPTGSPA